MKKFLAFIIVIFVASIIGAPLREVIRHFIPLYSALVWAIYSALVFYVLFRVFQNIDSKNIAHMDRSENKFSNKEQLKSEPQKVEVRGVNSELELGEQGMEEISSFESKRFKDKKPDFYEIAWQEIETNSVTKGLWSKAFAVADGDIEKTKANYIKFRVKCLEEAFESKLLKDQARVIREEQEKAERKRQQELEAPQYMAKRGLIVTSLDHDSSAKKKGLEVGDILIFYNQVDVRDDKKKFISEMNETPADSVVNMRIVRGDKFYDIKVKGGNLGVNVAELA